MAGTPKWNAMEAAIQALGGEESILESISNGLAVKDVAVLLDCSPALLRQWLRETPERQAKLREAQELNAENMVEEAREILDGSNPDVIGVDRERAKIRQWMAARLNRDAFGEAKSPTTVINLQALHLEAVKLVNAEKRRSQLGEAVEVLPAVEAGAEDRPLLRAGTQESPES